MPNTDLAEAEQVLKRIQRELTRQFFLHDNERVLITFTLALPRWRRAKARQCWWHAPMPRCIRQKNSAATGSSAADRTTARIYPGVAKHSITPA